jgi:predicted metal-dependent phosphoesterase TrpH
LSNPIDLHAHSVYSDGTRTPARLVAEAAAAGVRVLGLTDHDTVAGVEEAVRLGAEAGLRVIPGVEVSTSLPLGTDVLRRVPLHVLGYLIDPSDDELIDTLAFYARARVRRVGRMVERLAAIGRAVSLDRVFELAGVGTVGRVHVAQALVEAGHAADINDAFARFLGRGGPAYVPRPPVDTEEAIRLIRRAGGVPVLAHPREYERQIDLGLLLRRLVPAGLAGLEADYGGYDVATRARLRAIADRHGLLTTGGSDFHGPDVKADRPLGLEPVPEEAVAALDAAAAAIRAGGRP